MTTIHKLKTLNPYFNELRSGTKTFEVRKNDRNFKVGDVLILQQAEAIDEQTTLTGQEEVRLVSYVLQGGRFGIEEGYCVLGFRP